MKTPFKTSNPSPGLFPVLRTALLTILVLLHAAGAQAEIFIPASQSKTETMRLGARMYEEGILPSGKTMHTSFQGAIADNSSAFSCSSCHLRAGLGSVEGVVVTPPTTGTKLYKPHHQLPSPNVLSDRAGHSVYSTSGTQRPAYDRLSLANALRAGIDPAGRVLNDVMPRYPLSDRDMSILISYLETLSAENSPGASNNSFAFATIITEDVSLADRQAMLLPLQIFIDQKNSQFEMYNDFLKFGYTPTIDMKYAFHQASLDIWELKGPSDTWPRQLAAYYDNKPIFAVLGGISNGDWQPIHNFCEARRLPCLFPITDFPVVSETGWYTYYFNKGYAQEGETVASYLNHQENLPTRTPILQIVQDSLVGRALAAGFQSHWNELEHPAVTTLTLTADQLCDQSALDKIIKKHRPGVLLLWTDNALLPKLPELIRQLAAPGVVFVSSGYLGNTTSTIAETVRDRVYITYPYRLTPFVGSKNGGFDAKVPIITSEKDFGDRRIASRSTTMLKQVTLRGLNLLYDNLYRDHLLDILSMQMDLTVRDYERLSFGIGQRYISKGCYVIQLGPGAEPALLPRSEWIVH